MKKFCIAALAYALFATSATADDSVPAACDQFAPIMTKRTIDVFHDTTTNVAQKRAKLSALFDQGVDTDWIGKFVMGRYWAAASAADQQEFLSAYRKYLTLIYISKFDEEDGYNVENIRILSLTPKDAGTFEAKTLISRKGDDDVHVDYLLDQASGKCLVHDIKVEGVSLITSERSEFGTLAASSGLRGVIAAMQKQLANPQ